MVPVSDVSDRAARVVTTYSRVVILVMVLASVGIGAGITEVEQSSSLDQFQSETPEGDALEYAEANFTTGPENTTSVQIIVREDNVLSRQSLIEQLEFQETLRNDQRISSTFVEDQPTVGVANVIAVAAIRNEQATNLQQRAAALNATAQELNTTADEMVAALDQARALQREFDALNRTRENGNISETEYERRAEAIRANISSLRADTVSSITELEALDDSDASTFVTLFRRARSLQAELDALNASLKAGEISESEYETRAGEISDSLAQTYRGVEAVLAPAYQSLQDRADALEADRRAFVNAIRTGQSPPLSTQREQLESMNATAVESTVERVLEDDGRSRGVFSFMPTDFETGSQTASATVIVVRQVTEQSTAGGGASERIVDSQLVIQEVATAELGADSLVFGAGIINDEINRSMADSLSIVGPLALLFVLVVLIIAYRDPLDIVLGLVGIGLVLLWTFGFMGWADIDFNQLFVAVPVLLIGLSIDYAIHVFMRHREERARGDEDTVRGSMAVALASVGVALTYVTATTVIGFLSNLISSVPPIREFGVVSSVGIVAALLVFGILVPALKSEIDGALEAWGWDRRKRAFGTGGGRLGSVLAVGGVAARRTPWLVVLLTLAVSAAGAWGATNVDTTFDQEDFIADDPPEWMDRLPDVIQPGEYSAKQSLTYVNENFVREDSQSQILIRGDVTNPALLDRLAEAEDRAAESDVTVTLSNEEADLQSPLRAMRTVAARNESFAAVLAAADTDDDGRPDQNVSAVYDALFEAAPETARNVVYRDEEGSYRAVRMVVSVRGDAGGDRILTEMRGIADVADGSSVSVVATGRPIVFELVSEDLLSTVIESLLITLVAVFLFLMITYRLTHGSAILGIVTLLPVAFSVSWILGTMYLLGIPFNVLTGLITSLTVGLGVAYSIHLSERYSYEIRQVSDRWTAMRTALTGTGGALLGSAATTVGGFGVLVFAILPPLRQFGIITGLTIIYAFLGSVLVLPTLLTLWTRYLGPDLDDAPAPEAASRHLERSYVGPGAEYEVSITVSLVPGRTVLRETPPGEQLSIVSVSPEPVDVVTATGSAYVSWEVSEAVEARLIYRATVPDDIADSSTVSFDGSLSRAGETTTIDASSTLTVVDDVFDRLMAQEVIRPDDLRRAGEALETGELSQTEFERLYAAWLDQHPSPVDQDSEPD